MIRKISKILRILAGFLPVLNPGFLISVMMNDFTNIFMFRPWLAPWEMWLWLALAVTAGVLLCRKHTIPPGLAIALLTDPMFCLIEGIRYGKALLPFHVPQFLFYAVYAAVYLILRRKEIRHDP